MKKQAKADEKKIAKTKIKKIAHLISLYIKRNRKPIKIIIIIVACIIILLIFYFSFINIRFSIKEDLLIDIPARHIDLNITQENPANLDISSTVQTSIFCKGICTQKLVNVNSDEVVFNQSFEFRRFHKILFERTIYPYIPGEGQDIYSYSISCTNIATANCPVKDSNVEKNIIITLTRNLTEHELNLKKSQEFILNKSYSTFNRGLYSIDYSNAAVQQLKYAKTDDLIQYINNSVNSKKSFDKILSAATDAWLTYNHSFTQQVLQNNNLSSATQYFDSVILLMYNETTSRAGLHNNTLSLSYYLAKETLNLENSLNQSRQFMDNEKYDSLNSQIPEMNSLLMYSAKKVHNKNFNTYTDIFNILDSVNISINIFQQDYLNYMNNNSIFTKAQLDLLISQEDVCLIASQNKNINKTETKQNKTDINSCSKNFSNLIIDYSNITYENISSAVSSFCAEYSNLLNTKQNIEAKNKTLRENLSDEFLQDLNVKSAKYRIYNLKIHRQELMSRNDSSAIAAVADIDRYIGNLESNYNITDNFFANSPQMNNFISTFNVSLMIYFSQINFTFENIKECNAIKTAILPLNLSYEQVEPININMESPRYNNTLPALPPRACFDGLCQPFIENLSKNYPLVLVHGHGFYSQNNIITPAQIYNELQDQLFQDKLYVPAGIMRENEPIIPKSLSFVDVPFVYKAAYYPEEILNNESINLFADRLNSIILKVKEETGKDKVIIVAHSMGGLVTRAYLKKYGTGDVESVIIGGTPNYGVTSETVNLCKLFGRTLECDEMYQQSSFIYELKNESKYNIPIYTLRGVGCPTFGDDGDGVVQSKMVPLSYAENFAFNGTCSLTGNFHINLLNPQQNPKIYNKLKELLIKNNN